MKNWFCRKKIGYLFSKIKNIGLLLDDIGII